MRAITMREKGNLTGCTIVTDDKQRYMRLRHTGGDELTWYRQSESGELIPLRLNTEEQQELNRQLHNSFCEPDQRMYMIGGDE